MEKPRQTDQSPASQPSVSPRSLIRHEPLGALAFRIQVYWTYSEHGQQIDFLTFARSEGRFSKYFDKDANPSEEMLLAQQDRLRKLAAPAAVGGD